MALVPGIAMTNAMRDIMAGDMVAGISKGAEALLIGAAIALGTVLEYALPVAGLVFSISYLVGDSYNPFLYLQF